MDAYDQLSPNISNNAQRTAEICIWGGGLSGYSLARMLASKNRSCLIIDIEADVERRINEGDCPFSHSLAYLERPTEEIAQRIRATLDPLGNLGAGPRSHIICVPTERNGQIWDGALIDVIRKLSQAPRDTDPLYVVISSTVSPQWVDDIVHAEFRTAGWIHGADYHVSCAPRRDVFYDRNRLIDKVAMVVGGDTPEALSHALALFEPVAGSIHKARDAKHAALVKTVENLHRHVAIELSNRLSALLPGYDLVEILQLAGTKWNLDAYHPSLGIGGYCVPLAKDYILASHDGRDAAWLESVGQYGSSLAPQLVSGLEAAPDQRRVAVLGLAYAPGVKVHALSPAIDIIERLCQAGLDVRVHDPLYNDEETRRIANVGRLDFPFEIRDFDCAILMTNHCEYLRLSDEELASYLPRRLTVIDNTGAWKKRNLPAGVTYLEVGTSAYCEAVARWREGRCEQGRDFPTASSTPNALAEVNRGYLVRLKQDGELGSLFEHVDRMLSVDRDYLFVEYENKRLSIPALAERLRSLRERPVADWTESECDIICSLAAFGMAWVRLEYVDMDVVMSRVVSYLKNTFETYCSHLRKAGEDIEPVDPNLPWWELALLVASLREQIDRYWYRLAHINGKNWYRREVLIDRSIVRTDHLTQFGSSELKRLYGDSVDGKHPHEFLRRITQSVIDEQGTSLPLIEQLLRISAEDPETVSDFATLLCPRGTKLDEPWEMTREDFLAFVVFNRTFKPPTNQGVGDYQLIRKAMLAHHSAKKARIARKYLARYGPNSAASLADNLGDLGFYYNEDSYHKGHMVSGIVSAMRFLMPIDIHRDAVDLRVEGLTDFRLTRTDQSERARFRIGEFPACYTYGSFLRQVIEVTFENGIVLPAMIGNWR